MSLSPFSLPVLFTFSPRRFCCEERGREREGEEGSGVNETIFSVAVVQGHDKGRFPPPPLHFHVYFSVCIFKQRAANPGKRPVGNEKKSKRAREDEKEEMGEEEETVGQEFHEKKRPTSSSSSHF